MVIRFACSERKRSGFGSGAPAKGEPSSLEGDPEKYSTLEII